MSIAIKQAFGKKIPTNIPKVRIDNILFHSMENIEKWKFVYQRSLALERELGKDAFECKEVMSLIQEAGLNETVTRFGKCYEILVKEFIVNISKECDNKRSKESRKVYVRGRCVDFSPEIINRFLGRNEEDQAEVEVSDNVIWTKSSFNFGSYVFDQTMKHVTSYDVKMPIAFPSLICGVILSQHPSILISSNNIGKRDPPLSLHYRIFTRKHVPEIIMAYGQTYYMPTTRTCISAELKDTCKTLDETIKRCTRRKNKIEILIKALSKEEGMLKGDGIGEEEENE
ncbi:uncharacterized protein LOC127079051 [Lathyrus oleraceus]|uniref:uncharacterized protein LOC127079051 n=1 Tax=Pisum sativum TaxID=3888 RepID=UPI0021D1A417|nr:uncharacterized protein LOC127079051 [Pisum sativum]